MTDTSPLISCIVPVYNGERFLAEALDSILAQSWQPLEVIVVDDGSTDDTGEVLARYRPAVTVIRQPNAGPASARNRGASAAQGALLAFLDADDRWAPGKIGEQMARLACEPHLGFCVGKVQNFWEPEVAEEERRLRDGARARPLAGYVTGTLLVRREVFDRVGPFDPTLAHGDSADWFLRARNAGVEGALMDQVLLFRRLHLENRSRVHRDRSREEFFRLLSRSLKSRRSPGPPPEGSPS